MDCLPCKCIDIFVHFLAVFSKRTPGHVTVNESSNPPCCSSSTSHPRVSRLRIKRRRCVCNAPINILCIRAHTSTPAHTCLPSKNSKIHLHTRYKYILPAYLVFTHTSTPYFSSFFFRLHLYSFLRTSFFSSTKERVLGRNIERRKIAFVLTGEKDGVIARHRQRARKGCETMG